MTEQAVKYKRIDEWVEDYREGEARYEVNRAWHPHPQLAREVVGLENALKIAKEIRYFGGIIIMIAYCNRDDTEQLPVILIYDNHIMVGMRFADLLDHIFEDEKEADREAERQELWQPGDEPYEPDYWGAHYE